MRRPQLKSTFARAVVPVLAGIGFFLVIGLLLWGVAALVSHNRKDTTENLSPSYQELGSTSFIAGTIADGGPLVLQDLIGNDRNIVVDHTGADDNAGWALYLAHPADRSASCPIELIKKTRTFRDCEGRILQVDQLAAPPRGVGPQIGGGVITLDLVADAPSAGTDVTTGTVGS